ncbi:MAG TPA: prepilin-type N-terminal cleavage/methylation domain-containing protein [Sedimentisphaerales bacterium]|nr:prepilin-type N-terminal cleavage/methylation domain-containing protein [Sedimentisphaerales bacterium]HQI26989.1 prepilin-type N-terminal cleavage/methylation domain-containing protein [Sedimentisphaerales bacterium]
MKHQTSRIKRPKSVRGFTLIEALIATILVGFSIAALMAANGTLSMANGAGADQSTAEFLAEQIRELTAMLAVVDPTTGTTTPLGPEEASVVNYDDVDDFHGFKSSSSLDGPISATRTVLTEFSAFSQQVTVQNVSLANLDQVADIAHSSPFVRVTVQVLKNGRLICTTSWIRARY